MASTGVILNKEQVDIYTEVIKKMGRDEARWALAMIIHGVDPDYAIMTACEVGERKEG